MGEWDDRIPTLEEYLGNRAYEASDSAANAILGQKLPNVPRVPLYKGNLGLVSRAAGLAGMSDATRAGIFGYEPDPWTCLWTATSQYGDPAAQVAGNFTLRDNPGKYGFVNIPMREAQRGDLIQFGHNDTPEHSAIYTGEDEEHVPLVSYSRGGTGTTTITPEGEKPTMAYNVNIQQVINREGEPTAYRYIGSKDKHREWTAEYYDKYSNPKKASPNLPLFDFRDTQYKFPIEHSEGGSLFQPKSAWEALSQKEKADVMKVAVRRGITDLATIRQMYNTFAEGGEITSDQYYNTMHRVAEENNVLWNKMREEEGSKPLSVDEEYLRVLNDNSYDYRSFYNDNPDAAASADTHWPDTYKTAYHPTFSSESIYSGKVSKYNPEGLFGGYWINGQFMPAPWQRMWLHGEGGNLYKGGGSVVDDSLVDMIIKEEGFNRKPEDIGDGKVTLGSGLTNSRWHDLYKKRGNVWSEADNRHAVRTEAAEREQWARANIPNWKDLPDSSKRALLLYKYNFDFNRANSPKLFAALEAGNLPEAARQMDATSKIPKFRKGLENRRKREQALFLSGVPVTGVAPSDITIQQPVSTYVQNPYIPQQQNTIQLSQYVPSETEYVRTVELSPSQQRAQDIQNRFNGLMLLKKILGDNDILNTAIENFAPKPSIPLFDGLPEDQYAHGGRIHIKPSHRGRLTELKKRTGKTEAELYNDGNPAHKKMVVFARNSRKWHADGGPLYGPVVEAAKNLYGPGGTITYGAPHYLYDENGQLVRDESGKPVVNYNALLSDITVIPQQIKADNNSNVDTRSDTSRKGYHEGVTALNAVDAPNTAGIWDLVTHNFTNNPHILIGEPPVPAMGKIVLSKGNVTDNMLKWLGRPSTYRPELPLTGAPIGELAYKVKEGTNIEKYPGLVRMLNLWRDKGVDISRFGVEDLDDVYQLRQASLMVDAPSRYTLANQQGTNYTLMDYNNGMPVGRTDLYIDDSDDLVMSNIRNLTDKYPANAPNRTHDVQRRALNSAIAVAKSEGKDGVITGSYLQSAPKQYPAIFEHPERTVISNGGFHTNENMVPPGEFGMFGGWNGPAEASSVEEMWSNGDKVPMQLQMAPVWKLTEQSFPVPTKSNVFDPTIIDENGIMHTNWGLLDIFKGLAAPTIIGTAARKKSGKKRK